MLDNRRTIENVLERDPVIRKGLERGIINSRALARFIQEVERVDATPDAILGIIRRFPLEKKHNVPSNPPLRDCEITMRTRVGDLALEKGLDTMRRISDFAASIKSIKGQNMRVLTGLRHIRVIADQKALDQFRHEFLDKEIIRYSDNLVEISLLLTPETDQTRGIYAKITSELALNDVNLVGIWCCAPETVLIVNEEDGLKALEALQRMLSDV